MTFVLETMIPSRSRRWAIELYACNTPNGCKISVALEEMSLPYMVKIVDITKGEQFDPGFLKISPNNRIPAIVDPEVARGGGPLFPLLQQSGGARE